MSACESKDGVIKAINSGISDYAIGSEKRIAVCSFRRFSEVLYKKLAQEYSLAIAIQHTKNECPIIAREIIHISRIQGHAQYPVYYLVAPQNNSDALENVNFFQNRNNKKLSKKNVPNTYQSTCFCIRFFSPKKLLSRYNSQDEGYRNIMDNPQLTRNNFKHINLADADLSNKDLSHADFSKALFTGANLEGTKFYLTTLHESDFTDVKNLVAAQLSKAIYFELQLYVGDVENFLILRHAIELKSKLWNIIYKEIEMLDLDKVHSNDSKKDIVMLAEYINFKDEIDAYIKSKRSEETEKSFRASPYKI